MEKRCSRKIRLCLKKKNITLKYKISEAELEIEKILKKYKKIE